MIEIPGPIPIVIHPIFWIFAAMIGWLFSHTLFGAMIWVGIILVSVLFHEFGHALTAVIFRQKAQIRLIAFGGATSYEGPPLKTWQRFLIVLNGPIAGLSLFFLMKGCLLFNLPAPFAAIAYNTKAVNLIWSILNLLPVLPLDGGQLLRIVLEGIFGIRGLKISLILGMAFAFLISMYCFLRQEFLGGALFFLFGFQSFDLLRKSRFATLADRDESAKQALIEGEKLFVEGDLAKASERFEQVRKIAPKGMLFGAASQYLALIHAAQGDKDAAYDLLLPLEDQLSDDGRRLLHELAADRQNHILVAKLSAEGYQLAPSRVSALRNARAFAFLKQPEAAGGWVQTAWSHEPFDVEALVQEPVFADVRNDPVFQQFLQRLG